MYCAFLALHHQIEELLSCANLVFSYTQIATHVWNLDAEELKCGMYYSKLKTYQIQIPFSVNLKRLTWSRVPSSLIWCWESVCTRCPSLSQETAGLGCPITSQWRTTVLLTTAPISSTNSSDPPMITGGTEEVSATPRLLRNYFNSDPPRENQQEVSLRHFQ